MYIYHSRLHNGNSYAHALAGNFSGLHRDELLVCRNTVLELYIVNSHGNFERICYEDLFARILSMAVLHLNNKDYVAIGSESGYALTLSYEIEKNGFVPIMKKYYSMPVCLPENPGLFVATSHLGMGIGSLVETSLFFNLYKRKAVDIEKMEPMLSHQPKSITYDFVGIDNPNRLVPLFATLEVLCEQPKQDPIDLEITNLPPKMTEQELLKLLKPYGTVISTRITKRYKTPCELDPKKSVGVAIVRMETQAMSENVISYLHGKLIPGAKKELLVKFVFGEREPKKEKEENAVDYKQYLRVYQVVFDENKILLNQEELPEHGNMLISVPQGKEHPFGVILCFPDKITFKPFISGFDEVTRYIPQRRGGICRKQRGILLTSSAVFKISEGSFIFLVQTEQGDLFSIRIYERERKLLTMRIVYMDTIPVASSMCVISERLFVAAEFGDNFLYDIKSFGNESEMKKAFDGSKLVLFEARKLENLSIVDKISSISSVMQAYVSEFACNDMKKFIFACGRTPSPTLRFQRYGVKVSEVFEAVLPPLSNAVWSVNQEVLPGQTVTYILVSLMGRTMVLAMDETIKVDYNTGFCSKVPTLGCAKCSKDSIIQVNPNGFRHIRSDHQYTEKIISDNILRCALHCKQIAVALVIKVGLYVKIVGLYFEVQEENGKIHFEQVRQKTEFRSTVMCMSFIPRVIQSHHLVVCLEDTLEIYSVSLMKMECLTTYKLGRIPESLNVVTCLTNREEFSSVINIGYHDGYLQRIAVNGEKIVSEYTVKLGNKAVKLYSGQIQGNTAVLALTNKAWISFYPCSQVFNLAPMDIDQKSDFAFLSATSCPTANLVAISRDINGLSWETKLHFLSVSNSASMIEDNCVKLKYTPKSFVVNPKNGFLMIAETDIRHTKRKVFRTKGYIEMNPQRAMDLTTSDNLDSPPEKDAKTVQDLETSDVQSSPSKEDLTKKPRSQTPKTSDAQSLPPKEDAIKLLRDEPPKTSDTESLSSEDDVVENPSLQVPETSDAPPEEDMKASLQTSEASDAQTLPPKGGKLRRRYAYPNTDLTQKVAPKDVSKGPPAEDMNASFQTSETSDAQTMPPEGGRIRRRRYAYPNTDLTRKVAPTEDVSKRPPEEDLNASFQTSETSDAQTLPPEGGRIRRRYAYPNTDLTRNVVHKFPPKVPPKSSNEKPSSCAVDSRLQIFDPVEMETVFSEELPVHIAAVCMSFLQLKGHRLLLLVGTQRVPQIPGQYIKPVETIDSHDIYIYEVTQDGKSFSLISKHKDKHVASSICQIGNHVLVGHCNMLCLYGFHWTTKTLQMCDKQEAKHRIVNIWSHKQSFVVETSDEVLTYGVLVENSDNIYMVHQDRFMQGVSCLCFWDDNIIFVGDRKEIHAVLLPYWKRNREDPMYKVYENELKEVLKRLKERQDNLSATQIHDIVEDIECINLAENNQPPSGTNLHSPTSPRSPSKKGEAETTFKITSRSELADSKPGSSSQDPHSPSKAELSSHSPSKAGPSTSRTGESSRAESHSSISPDPIDDSHLLPVKYSCSFLRLSQWSHVLITQKIGEYVQSVQKTSLIKEGCDLIVYTTLSGAVGVIVPFLTETHHKFFGPLEYLTFKMNPLLTTNLMAPLNPHADPGDIFALCCDTDQVAVDGNVCEVFCKLPRMLQHLIAAKLNTTYLELLQEIEKMKTTVFV